MYYWPTPELLSTGAFGTCAYISKPSNTVAFHLAKTSKLLTLLTPLGLQKMRVKRLRDISAAYLASVPEPTVLYKSRVKGYPPTPISHFPGSGAYAMDSYTIFCGGRDEWKRVLAQDKELVKYLVCPLHCGVSWY